MSKRPRQSNSPVDQFNAAVEKMQKAREDFQAEVTEFDKSRLELEAERSDWEEEKARIANTQKLEPLVDLNVGGTRFTARLETLQKYPESMLSAMFSGRHTLIKTAQDEHFIDRSGFHFRHILDFLREPENYKVDLTCLALEELKREALYFGFNDVMFPAPPPPVPVAPFTLKITNGSIGTITQTADGIYYGEYDVLGKRIMTI